MKIVIRQTGGESIIDNASIKQRDTILDWFHGVGEHQEPVLYIVTEDREVHIARIHVVQVEILDAR